MPSPRAAATPRPRAETPGPTPAATPRATRRARPKPMAARSRDRLRRRGRTRRRRRLSRPTGSTHDRDRRPGVPHDDVAALEARDVGALVVAQPARLDQPPVGRSKTYPCIGHETQAPVRVPSARLAPAWSHASSMAHGPRRPSRPARGTAARRAAPWRRRARCSTGHAPHELQLVARARCRLPGARPARRARR